MLPEAFGEIVKHWAISQMEPLKVDQHGSYDICDAPQPNRIVLEVIIGLKSCSWSLMPQALSLQVLSQQLSQSWWTFLHPRLMSLLRMKVMLSCHLIASQSCSLLASL